MSSLREWLVSTQPEEITEEQLRRGASARLVLCFSAVLIDVGIYAFFRNHPKIDPAVLQFFAVVNIVLLSLLGLITYLGHARARAPKVWLLYALMPFEILSVVIWIQVTGTISSYFIIVGPLIFVVYRGFIRIVLVLRRCSRFSSGTSARMRLRSWAWCARSRCFASRLPGSTPIRSFA